MKNNLTQVYRDVKTSNYSMISNEVLKRPDLSWKAKGIMAYILSLPDDWTIYLEELETHATDGKASFRAGWNELKAKGYVERKPIRDDKKIIAWQTIVHESVGKQVTDLLTDFQEVGNQEVENLLVDNQKLLITNNTNNLNNKDIASIPYSEIINYLNEKTGRDFRNVPSNKSYIKARCNEGYKLEDFKSVIDNKCADWLSDQKMSKYLQPSTLFGAKFDQYLNQGTKTNVNNPLNQELGYFEEMR